MFWLCGIFSSAAFAQEAPPSSALVRQMNDAFATAFEKVAPAVVILDVERSAESPVQGLPEGLEFFLRGEDGSKYRLAPQEGSGVIISKDGYILTNNHVVESAAENGITVRLRDGRKFEGRVIGSDEKSDLAVVKIEANDLPAAEFADSDTTKVGHFVFAVGAPEGLAYTFTAGIVSAKGRSELQTNNPYYEEYIQTDASINPGNSGGPLCDIDGHVVGINTMISGLNRGLGFAIPGNLAREISRQLIGEGRVRRPWLGISIVGIGDLEKTQGNFPGLENGVLVRLIEPNTPAGLSQLRESDVIVKVDDVPVAAARDLQRLILKKTIGQTVQLDVWRDGKIIRIPVQTGELPEKLVRTANRNVLPKREESADLQPEASDRKPFGVRTENLPPGGKDKGVLVTEVQPYSEAAAAGLQAGDVVVEVGGKPVRNKEDFEKIMSEVDSSRGVMLFFERSGARSVAILKSIPAPGE